MTVGLVIVSHSVQLARGVAELAGQMVQGKVPIAAAGGAGEQVLGTSADIILQAIQSVDNTNGVLILLDLGSAILSAEMALEFLDEQQRSRVQLSFAPLVEGAVAAALDASLGHTLAQVKAAAEQTAHEENLRHLKPITSSDDTVPTTNTPADTIPTSPTHNVHEIQLQITNPSGLHARPASLFVQTAARFQANIQVQRAGTGQSIEATSILGILSLGIRQGEMIILRAHGPDVDAALRALQELVAANFHEQPTQQPISAKKVAAVTTRSPKQPPNSPLPSGVWQGIAVSSGVALGPLFLTTGSTLALTTLEQRTISSEQVDNEQKMLKNALQTTTRELQALAQQLRTRVGDEAAIFDAQALMLQDATLRDAALQLIQQNRLDAASALAHVGEQQAHSLAQLDDALLAARATDIRDAVSRAITHLRANTVQHPLSEIRQPSILLAHDLTPSDTAQLHPDLILGICTVQGGPTAHAAILARALGIPALAGIPESALQQLHSGQEVALDATQGLLYVQPTGELRTTFVQRVEQQRQQHATLQARAKQQRAPLWIGKRHIRLFANVGSIAEAEAARQWGAEGIGLLRTEFLLANPDHFPDEQEQRQLYTQVFQAFLGSNPSTAPIVVRTLDAGADKPMPTLTAMIGPTTEANPALGVRGIRLHLAHKHLLEQQLRALLLAAADTGTQLHIMFPMLTTVEELRSVKTIFTNVYTQLSQQATPPRLPAHVPLGIMIEVPAAAIMAPELAAQVDFFSIGANDLLQYTLASDRTNAALASLYNPMQPALLRLIRDTATAARKAGKLIAVCGEMASDPRLAPLLVGLGIDELSMTPTALAAVRASLTGRNKAALTTLAEKACRMQTVAEVEGITLSLFE